MFDSEISVVSNSCDRQIEDIIDARKKCGDYNIGSQPNTSINCRYAYSAPTAGLLDDRFMRMEETALWISEGDLNAVPGFDTNSINIGQTDSEITIVRVKREGLQFKNDNNNWDMHDEAIPGDGTHLGESPSMVNLVTLVGRSISVQSLHANLYEGNEYLVPLSSWDPSDRPRELPDIHSTMEANTPVIRNTENLYLRDAHQRSMIEFGNKYNRRDLDIKKQLHECKNYQIIAPPDQVKFTGLAAKFSKFVKKHCTKRNKTLVFPAIPVPNSSVSLVAADSRSEENENGSSKNKPNSSNVTNDHKESNHKKRK